MSAATPMSSARPFGNFKIPLLEPEVNTENEKYFFQKSLLTVYPVRVTCNLTAAVSRRPYDRIEKPRSISGAFLLSGKSAKIHLANILEYVIMCLTREPMTRIHLAAGKNGFTKVAP